MELRQALPAGTMLLDHYRIEHVLGVGGFGITYAAVDMTLDLPVAIKEYFPTEFGVRTASLEVRPARAESIAMFNHCLKSFEREAQTLAQFRHASIVRVLRVFEANGTAYMVMEFERGRPLEAWLADLKRRPTQAELDLLVRPLTGALEIIHSAHVIHRDIAPDNVLIRADGSPVLIDFGAARQVVAHMSRNLTGIVKQGYSPPEQYALDQKLQGPWTDIFALGGVLYLLVTGQRPTPAPERQLGIAMKTAVQLAGPGYRPQFLAAIDRALEVRPGDRPQAMVEFKQLLFAGARDGTRRPEPRPPAQPTALPGSLPQGPYAADQSDHPQITPPTRLRLGLAAPIVAGALFLGFVGWQASKILTRPALPATSTAEPDRRIAVERQAAEDRRRIEAERQRQEAEKQAEIERQRLEADKRAAVERQAADDRRRAAEQAEAERRRLEAEKRVAADERRRAVEQAEAERQRRDTERQAAEATRVLVTDIRRELNRLGCRTESSAPTWSDADQRALARFVEHSGNGISFPAFNREIVTVLARFRDRVCPIECRAGETLSNGRCQRIPPASGPSAAVQCRQINERAQLGILSEEDRDALRRLNCG